MINNRFTQNYLADCASKHLPPELQAAARQGIADKLLTPLLFEAVAKQIEESAVAAAKAGAGNSAQAIAELTSAVRSMEKSFTEKGAADFMFEKIRDELSDVISLISKVRNDQRTIEDKVDTLVPYQLWKVVLIASIALGVGAVASWNIRPAYKQWVWEQQQKEGR